MSLTEDQQLSAEPKLPVFEEITEENQHKLEFWGRNFDHRRWVYTEGEDRGSLPGWVYTNSKAGTAGECAAAGY